MSGVTRPASTLHEKVWGRPSTEPWLRNPEGRRIGEVWFETRVPLLVKLLFTSENLSVQTHPDDAYAREHENSAGKTEMWHILAAEPGAKIAVGVREAMTRERLRAASLSGEIMDLLRWVEVAPGETYFIPAGTIHAIGAGITLCEVQQVSDVTYRLYDYGRGRELHLDRGAEVARLEPRECLVPRVRVGDGRELLAECGYFRTERVEVRGRAAVDGGTILVALEGEGFVDGEAFRVGDAFEVAVGEECLVESEAAVFLTTTPGTSSAIILTKGV